jgi:Flp pilus assembly protein TadB
LIWLVVPAITVTGVLALGWLEPRSARRRRQRLIMEGPQALELLAACLAAGLPAPHGMFCRRAILRRSGG